MKMLAAALALAATTVPAYAMTYFLTDQWVSNGARFCKYGNAGAVLGEESDEGAQRPAGLIGVHRALPALGPVGHQQGHHLGDLRVLAGERLLLGNEGIKGALGIV